MYIQPNTTIKLLKGVPLDNTYTDTIYFESEAAQAAHFQSDLYAPMSFSAQSYQRVQRGKMRVAVKADAIYNRNYLMFKNTAYGNKWFYAFITAVEYVNDITSEITFELDVMQTWFFEWRLGECYVEREHTVTDEIGENIAPEPIDLGTITCASIASPDYFADYSIVVVLANEQEGA